MSEWISVKDRLPELPIFWCIVLTINSDNESFAFMAYSNTRGKWNYFDDDKGYEKSMKVTHWMPLPAAPEGE